MLSFTSCTTSVSSASLLNISYIICIFKMISFSSVSYTASVLVLCMVASSSSTSRDYSCCSHNPYVIFHCSSFSCSTTLYSFLLDRSAIILSVGGRVFMHSVARCTCSRVVLIFSSSVCNYILLVRSIHMCVPSSHIFMHSYSNIFIFSTNVWTVLYLFSLSSGGVPGNVCSSSLVILC
jgi:hypothetical protein